MNQSQFEVWFLFPKLLGDMGNCGNYAIALHRLYKHGKFVGAFDKDQLEHVFYEYYDVLYDVYNTYSWDQAFEQIDRQWLNEDYEKIDEMLYITEKKIFQQLPKTTSNEKIKLIMDFLIFHKKIS